MAGYTDNASIIFINTIFSEVNGKSSWVGGLMGSAVAARTYDSYWDTRANVFPSNDRVKSSTNLHATTDFTGIYGAWDSGVDLDNEDGDGNLFNNVEDTTRWCAGNRIGAIDSTEKRNDNYLWGLGTAQQYPVLCCAPVSPQRQREFIRTLENN